MMIRTLLVALALLPLFATPASAAEKAAGYTLVVMDPLSIPLSCPCVKGYAQRDYEKLRIYLESQLGRPVKVVFKESLAAALEETEGRADIVIGKHSVVLADAQKAKRPLTPVLSLTGKDGQTMMTGLVVVPAADPAITVADLQGYRIIFGPADCDEKHAAALNLLKTNKVEVPAELETCAACSDGATTILALGEEGRAATVISSYAAPLLEGCGTIQKGDLRVIGTTAPVPFVEAFVSQDLSDEEQAAITNVLTAANAQAELRKALETRQGFLPIAQKKTK